MKQKQTRSILARLVQRNDEMFGVFRLTASRSRAMIRSICGEFRTDLSFKVLQLPTADELFFYGHGEDLKPNFRTPQRAEFMKKILFPLHIKAHYSKKTPPEERNGEGYARIPIEEMEFDPDRHNLLTEVLYFYSTLLEGILEKKVRVEMPQKDTQDFRCTIGQLKKYPMELVNLALKYRYYFLLRRDDTLNYDGPSQLTSGQTFELPQRSYLAPFKPKNNH